MTADPRPQTLRTPGGRPDAAVRDPVIQARGLAKRYGNLTALGGVSFEVARGEIFGVLGPNGAGKTTLVEILEGLTEPSDGSASVLGLEVTRQSVEVKRRIGVQLQASSYHQYLTLREILDLFGSFYPRAVDPMTLLRRVRLEDRASARIGQLSGGMQQRFSIVAALVNDPELVFFDEPTAGLDPDARHDLWEIVRDVREGGATVVMTTHYMEEAEALCDRVAFMNAGQMVALDTPPGLVRRLHAPYRIRVTTAEPLDRERIDLIPGISEVGQTQTGDGYLCTLRASHGPSVTAALAALAEEQDTTVVDLAVLPATLEDVFMSVTGRGLSS